MASASASSSTVINLEAQDPELVFFQAVMDLVSTFYKHDKSPTDSNASAKLVDYVRKAPRYGITSTLASIRTTLTETYNKNREEILENYDDWIFRPPHPLLLQANRKIYMAIGNIYTRVEEKYQDDLHKALIRVMVHVTESPEDKAKLQAFAGEKEAEKGMDGIGSMLKGLIGGEGMGEDLTELMSSIMEKLKGSASNPEDPSTLDANAIGNLVKELITDKSKEGFFEKIRNNPSVSAFSEKLKNHQGIPDLLS